MKYGVCCGFDMIDTVEKCGFDYIEVNALSIASMDETQYNQCFEIVKASSLTVEAACVLFPGEMRLTGDGVNLFAIEHYLHDLFPKLKKLGIDIVVFGSGNSRKYPDNFTYEKAYNQLIQVGEILGKHAYNNGLTVTLEPLNIGETNIINKLQEGMSLVNDVALPSFMLLADWYHCVAENDTGYNIIKCGEFIRHTHIASPVKRINPTPNDEGRYEDFFNALNKINYNTRVSFEGSNVYELINFGSKMLKYLKALSVNI